MITKTKITIEYVSPDALHPLYVQGTVQPTYVELDLDSGDLSADYSGDVGGGVPERVWNGEVVRYAIDPDLTASEINQLLDEIGAISQEWIDAREQFEPGAWGRGPIDYDAGFKIQQLCDRQTESGGVLDAGMWIEADGMNQPLCKDHNIDGVDLRHDSTDKELDEIARKLQELARDEGVTLVNLDSYLIDQRDEAATDHISSSCNSLSDNKLDGMGGLDGISPTSANS
jgi:hypothetical protein